MNILELISDLFEFLQRERFIEKSGFRYFATPLGSLTSRLYIDPLSAIMIRDGLTLVKSDKPLSVIGALHLICSCPDAELLKGLSKTDMESLNKFTAEHHKEFILTPENAQFDDFYAYLATVKTSWMLLQWIEEEKEELICEQFNIGPGDVYRLIEATQWLLYAASNIAHLQMMRGRTFELENLRTRMRYGIKEELLDIVQLKGVGRIRARNLFNNGFKRLDDLKSVPLEKLALVPTIGKTLAKDILAQVNNKEE